MTKLNLNTPQMHRLNEPQISPIKTYSNHTKKKNSLNTGEQQ